MLLLGVLVLVGAILALVNTLGGKNGGSSTSSVPAQTATKGSTGTASSNTRQAIAETGILPKGDMPAIEAGVLPWTLGSPLSRAVAVPGPGPNLTLVGGLNSAQATIPTIVAIDTQNGQESTVGNLASGVHDAAVARIGRSVVVLGGGSPDTVATVQRFPTPATIPVTSPITSTTGPSLPEPRSDASAVTIGDTTYVVGGYTGSKPLPEVLSTVDGTHFSVLTSLPVSVRYPAVAALGGLIYVFGGQMVGGAHDGSATDVIQVVDPATKTASIVGHLPQPLAGAVAVVLDHHIYIAGGTASTSAAQSSNPNTPLTAVWAYDATTHHVLHAGNMPFPTSYAAATVVGGRAWILGGEDRGQQLSSVEMLSPNPRFGAAGMSGAGSPYFGAKLLIADRGNNRLLLLDDNDQILWTYPSTYAQAPPGGFYFPDDAFFAKGGTEIISNQEDNHTIVIIGFPSGKLLWQYGHPATPGSAVGYLHQPDDAYILKDGVVTVADAENCRILFINPDKTVAGQIGTDGLCQHQPPTDVGYPNGDTPLLDGDVLVSEIDGSWITEYTPSGRLVWTVQLPSVGYVSDPQQLGPDRYLVSDYSHPGAIIEFNRAGQILYSYRPTSGPGELNQPSLTELLPSGVFMSNDDYRDRMVAIDPATQALVWQYGVSDTPGTAPGLLNTPDGFDILMPDGSTPTHPATG